MPTNTSNELIVIGGGAAGMMAADTAAGLGVRTLLLEKNDRLGKKLFITGKGRCNVTNACAEQDFYRNIPRNPRFLYSAFSAFSNEDAMRWFSERGCPLKVERGNRVFPESDKSASIVDTLRNSMVKNGVSVQQETVKAIIAQNGSVTAVKTDRRLIPAKAVILCTGGCSYPLTGSTGDGYRMAQSLGHTIVEPVGSLVPLVEKGYWCKQMQGLSLRNVSVRMTDQKSKCVFEEFGELLFTHFGLSGPVILSASAHMNAESGYVISIDLKPALDEQKLDARLLRDFEENQNRNFENALSGLLPKTMIPVIVKRSGIAADQKVNSVTKEQRKTLLRLLKDFTVEIACKAPVEDAIITSGGVKVSEIEPKTMQSKLVKGLYFAGEIIDVDAYTGGFNLQIAWSTAYAAATAAALNILEDAT